MATLPLKHIQKWIIPNIKESGDDEEKQLKPLPWDFSDRMHWHIFTKILFILASASFMAKMFGTPISCLLPAQYDEYSGWRDYIHNVCYSVGRYTRQLPKNSTGRVELVAAFYHWVPMSFAVQLATVLIPYFIWDHARQFLFLDVDTVLNEAKAIRKSISSEETAKTESKLEGMAEYLLQLHIYTPSPFSFLQSSRNSLSLWYLVVKCATLVLDMLLFVSIAVFLDTDDLLWGVEVLSSFSFSVPNAKLFPVRVFCNNVTLLQLGNRNEESLQCILPLNFFLDRVFAALWVAYIVLIMLACVAFVKCLYNLLPLRPRLLSLISSSLKEKASEKIVDEFAYEVLCPDILLILFFVQSSLGNGTATAIADSLFISFAQKRAHSAWCRAEKSPSMKKLEVK